MSSTTYWPFAPLTKDLIDTTLKLHQGFGPTSQEYKNHLLSMDPMVGKSIEALYLMGRTIIPDEVGPDGDIQMFLADAQKGESTSYMDYLTRTPLAEMVNRALRYLEGDQRPLAPA